VGISATLSMETALLGLDSVTRGWVHEDQNWAATQVSYSLP
jgi:hypothetical protein